MTIMKAIAMAALAGTLIAGPGAAFAQATDHSGTHGNSGAARQNNDTRKAGQNTAKPGQDDQDTDDDTTGSIGGVKANGKTTFGTIISGLQHANTTTDLSGLQSGFTVDVVNLDSYAKGNNSVAIDNALRKIDQTSLQTTLSANADVVAALQQNNLTVADVAYAYVDAQGNLVVYTR